MEQITPVTGHLIEGIPLGRSTLPRFTFLRNVWRIIVCFPPTSLSVVAERDNGYADIKLKNDKYSQSTASVNTP